MREHGLGDERRAELDELGPGVCRHSRGLIRMRFRIIWPALFGDLVGVDEGTSRQQRRERELDKRRLAGSVGSDDEIEPLHWVGAALAFLRRGARRFAVSATEEPSGRCSMMSPFSSRATVVTPRSAN